MELFQAHWYFAKAIIVVLPTFSPHISDFILHMAAQHLAKIFGLRYKGRWECWFCILSHSCSTGNWCFIFFFLSSSNDSNSPTTTRTDVTIFPLSILLHQSQLFPETRYFGNHSSWFCASTEFFQVCSGIHWWWHSHAKRSCKTTFLRTTETGKGNKSTALLLILKKESMESSVILQTTLEIILIHRHLCSPAPKMASF